MEFVFEVDVEIEGEGEGGESFFLVECEELYGFGIEKLVEKFFIEGFVDNGF